MVRPQRSQAAIVTILNLKGGVGKTHVTWLLAGMCSERQKRCLCLDLDPQGNLSRNLFTRGKPSVGTERLFHPADDIDIRELILPSDLAGVDAISADSRLASFDHSEKALWEKSDLQRVLFESLGPLRADYDYILLDCPPRLSLVSFAALVAADFALVPLESADWGAQGVTEVTEAVQHVQEHERAPVQILGYVISRFKTARTYQHAYLAKLREHFGDLAFDTVISDLAGFEKSVTHAIPVNLRRPASKEASIARQFFDEFERRIETASVNGSRRRRPGVSKVPIVAV